LQRASGDRKAFAKVKRGRGMGVLTAAARKKGKRKNRIKVLSLQ
jgi:hypothetical protein